MWLLKQSKMCRNTLQLNIFSKIIFLVSRLSCTDSMKVFLFRKSIGPHAYALICLKTPAKLDSFAIPCDII